MPIDKHELDERLKRAIMPKEPKGYPSIDMITSIRNGGGVYEEAGKIEASLGVVPKKDNASTKTT